MFRKSRIKIVALLVGILVLVLLGTIVVIYGVSYNEMIRENRDMLELYASEYLKTGGPPEEDNEREEPPDGADELPPEEEALSVNEASTDGDVQTTGDAGLLQNNEAPEESGTDTDQVQDENGVSDDQTGERDNSPDRSHRRMELSTFYSVAFSADGSVLEIYNDGPSQISDEALTELAQKFLKTGKTFGISRNMIYLISGEDYTLVSLMDNTLIGESMVMLLRYTFIFGAVAVLVVLILSIFLSGWIIKPLEENYERQNRFISDAGHELKTPVSTISTNVELLQREIGENRWLDNIRYENDRMTEIVRSLLDLLRAENMAPQGERLAQETQMEWIDLSRAVTAGTLPFEARAFEEGFDLSCDIASNLFIQGDAAQLGKLISILIDNAFAHTNPSGKIRVSLTDEKTSAVLMVSNEGAPIPEEAMDRIFDRFYRVDSSRTLPDQTSAAQPHYGLGLSIAKAIATAHQAKISVSCGGGITKFIVTFPLHARQ